MQRGMCKQVQKFVFFLGMVLLKQMEHLCNVFLRSFPKPSGIRCSDFAKRLSFKILMKPLRCVFSRLQGL